MPPRTRRSRPRLISPREVANNIFAIVDARLRLRPPKGVDRDLYLHWCIGRILEGAFKRWKNVKKDASNFPYGERFMASVAEHLRSSDVRQGPRVLWASLQLYRVFSLKAELPRNFVWAGMRFVLRIGDPDKIRKIARKAARVHMTTRQIQNEIGKHAPR